MSNLIEEVKFYKLEGNYIVCDRYTAKAYTKTVVIDGKKKRIRIQPGLPKIEVKIDDKNEELIRRLKKLGKPPKGKLITILYTAQFPMKQDLSDALITGIPTKEELYEMGVHLFDNKVQMQTNVKESKPKRKMKKRISLIFNVETGINFISRVQEENSNNDLNYYYKEDKLIRM